MGGGSIVCADSSRPSRLQRPPFPDPAEAHQAEQDQEKKDAYVYAREIVKEQLKVPKQRRVSESLRR